MTDILEQQMKAASQIQLEDCFKSTEPGMFLEFGVAGGGTIRRIAAIVTDIVWGFDSWEGIPEQFGPLSKGFFRCEPPTDVPSHVRLVKGLFQDTLPQFLLDHPGPISFVHIDCDLYNSAKFVLDQLKDRLDRTVIMFDEIRHDPVYEANEGKAFREFLAETGYKYDCLGIQANTGAAFKLYR